MSAPMKPNDPAYWMLEQGREDPSKRSTKTAHSNDCYICRDPEFALMGLPLCYPCGKCGGHVAADDCVCDECKCDQREIPVEDLEAVRQKAEHEARARRCANCGIADMPFEPVGENFMCVDVVGCEIRRFMMRGEPSKEDEAHELIAFAADAERGLIERSNQFDRWKQLLGELAGSATSKPVYYRQILGLLLEKVTRKDVTDFAADVLARIVTATYYLRSEAPNASHVNYILDVLRPHSQTGLSVDELSEEQIAKLEAIERRIRGE